MRKYLVHSENGIIHNDWSKLLQHEKTDKAHGHIIAPKKPRNNNVLCDCVISNNEKKKINSYHQESESWLPFS